MNEPQTRLELIDTALRAAGWGVMEDSRILVEHPVTIGRLIGYGKRAKPMKADYVLQYKGRKLAVVEAKSDEKYYTEGVAQAKIYAEKLQIRFTYSTNGRQHYGIDMQLGKEEDVASFPSPDELWAMTFAEENYWRDKLLSFPYKDKGEAWQIRYYQEIAVTRVIEAVAKGQNKILLTLATGTGKTSIAFQIAWKLFQGRWNIKGDGKRLPRILFLADRNILASQAFNDFNSFSAFEEEALVRIDPDSIRKKGEVPKNGSVFFTIFQTFMSGENDSSYFGDYPNDFFDFIIIDECHRGGANDESTWRDIMDYFSPAVQLGLTATPKRDKNIDTYRYFGEPVYIYSLKEGINDGFLTPFKVKQIDTTIDEYIYTSDDEVIEGDIVEGKRYTEQDFNKIIEIRQREEYRVKLFMDMMDQAQKTIVFCANQPHALAIRDLINQKKKSKNPDYCHRVTADDGALGEQYLRNFQDNEKSIPTVLTTSQKLSTGVDARQIRNIVLLRPINSMVEFKQIVGRGTRLFDGKDYFTIYDFVKAHHHFADKEWDGEPEEPESGEGNSSPRPPKTYTPPDGGDGSKEPQEPYKVTKVRLPDGKVMQFQNMVKTSFWSSDGKPISLDEFLQSLFNTLPEHFKSEEELRNLWSKPVTRKELLNQLSDKGFTTEQLREFQQIIKAENCDLYDVLSYIAFHAEPIARSQRAENARKHFELYNTKHQQFLDFVLQQYIRSGFEQLDDVKLFNLLELKYHTVADAKKELGNPDEIRKTFIGFQGYLY